MKKKHLKSSLMVFLRGKMQLCLHLSLDLSNKSKCFEKSKQLKIKK